MKLSPVACYVRKCPIPFPFLHFLINSAIRFSPVKQRWLIRGSSTLFHRCNVSKLHYASLNQGTSKHSRLTATTTL